MEGALAINRTPEIIAAEINSIKEQARLQILCNSIEIGRRLIEAKEMLPHGEWGKWLEGAVDYSQSTANNLMRIAEEYGAEQWSLFGADAKSQALGKLNYTQAVVLLGLPAGEREEFIDENDVENMSTRELQKAIRERDAALKAAEDAQKAADEKEEELREAKAELEDAAVKAGKEKEAWAKKLEDIEAKLREAEESGSEEEVLALKDDLKDANDEIEELNQRLKEIAEKPIDVQATVSADAGIPEEVERELEQLRKMHKSAAALKYKLYFDGLVKGFNDLLGALEDIREQDLDIYSKYQHATLELISKMSDRV